MTVYNYNLSVGGQKKQSLETFGLISLGKKTVAQMRDPEILSEGNKEENNSRKHLMCSSGLY